MNIWMLSTFGFGVLAFALSLIATERQRKLEKAVSDGAMWKDQHDRLNTLNAGLVTRNSVLQAELNRMTTDNELFVEALEEGRTNLADAFNERVALVAENADLREALADAQREIKALGMMTIESPVVPKRPTRKHYGVPKKAVGE